MKKLLLNYLLFCLSINCYSQKILWEQTLGGNNSEYLLDMIPTADNGFLLAGATQSYKGADLTTERSSNYDAWLWKMKASGKKEWDMRIGGNGDNFLNSIAHTLKDGGFILGLTSSSDKDHYKTEELIGKSDAWIIKLDAARNMLWQKSFGGLEKEDLVKVLPITGGDYLVLINSNSSTAANKTVSYYGGEDIWVIRINSQGIIKWQKSFGGEYDDIGSDVIATSDKGFLIGGYSNSGVSGNKTSESYGNNDYWVIKINAQGDTEWQRSYGAEKNDQLKQIQEVSKDSYRLYGISDSDTGMAKNSVLQSEVDYWSLDIDNLGQVKQELAYGYGTRNFLSNGLVKDNGTILLGGTTLEKTKQGSKVNFLGTLLNKQGDVLWQKSISGKGENVLSKLIETRDGAYVFAGTSDSKPDRDKSSQKGMNDFWLVKVKGNTFDENQDSQTIEEDTNQEKLKIEAIPNPVVTYTNIIIPVEYKAGVLKLYDITGRLLFHKTIKNQTEPLNLSGYPRGTYIISVKTDVIEGSVNVVKE
ncbi:T9SS type A sorting domain-containing protein [Myroides sp. M-43]|uniref:T9SS type A sorting domain-containing protein n=1 Tax=Myroides oncorhynchi TaxID=2893756 RepID=UPI001E49EC4F|nr:T9SS type A sorting domain-containing protein [Myroides oncorhynchi]MCC9043639.1 T9SS type A sorting domain-containing protein [Myroides oncorhynchi]